MWKKTMARGSSIQRGRFTIGEISFLWGLGFLGNPITEVKRDLGSWPYTVHRPSHRLGTAMVYTIGVSYLFGIDTNRRAPRGFTASHSHGRFQMRVARINFSEAFLIDVRPRYSSSERTLAAARTFAKMADPVLH